MRNTGGLASLFARERFVAVGLMSGTSMDGVDAALVSLDADSGSQDVELRGFASLDYPEELREALGDLAIGHETTAEEVATLNTGVAVTFAGSFFDVCRRANVEPQSVDFIGSHGQTVAHVPPQAKSGTPIAGTLQLGAPSMIAALTGVTTVGDFRSGDVAVGGQGAPLTPYVITCCDGADRPAVSFSISEGSRTSPICPKPARRRQSWLSTPVRGTW
jgi:anhydro-N-acetylmuramic acid kinase